MAFQTLSKLNATGTILITSGGGFLFSAYASGACSFYDTVDPVGGIVGTTNLIATLAAGVTQIDFPFRNGLVMVGGATVASVSYAANV
jgi:hypothetical protein